MSERLSFYNELHIIDELHTDMNRKKKIERVLVTGGAGYVGSVLVRLLLEHGCDVTILDSFLYYPESLRGIEKKVRIVNGDTRDIVSVATAVHDVDAVVHLAEIVGESACNLDPGQARAINVDGTRTVAQLAKEHGIKKFIYISSCSVYGVTTGDRLFTEEDQLNPVSTYAELKIQTENNLKSLADNTFSVTILRLATVYGVSFRPRFDLLLNTVVARALTEQMITIQGKDSWRPFVHVADVGAAIIAMLPLPHQGVEIFNVGHATQNHTILEIGNMVHKRIPDAEITILEQASSDKRSYRVDFSKIEKMIHFVPQHTIASGIEELIEFLKTKSDVDYKTAFFSNVETMRGKL